jgi:hypothetical protein
VSVPQGPAWQALRQRALDAVPSGSQPSYTAPMTLRDWQTQGAYTVANAATQQLDIVAFSTEIGGVILTEAEHYLDHAAEHQAVVFRQFGSKDWTSGAWQVVTVYYWAYFALLALTRLLGDFVWLVDNAVAKQLSKLAPAGSPRLGAGTFRFTCGPILTSTEREVKLRRQKGRAHDSLWKVWAALVQDIVQASPPVAGSDEDRLFTAMRTAAAALGPDWPSGLRNVVNYRPGFSYTAVRFPKATSAIRHVQPAPLTFADRLASFESSVSALDRKFPLVSQPHAVMRALADYTLVLHALSLALHSEVVDRIGADKRWRRSRVVFLERHGVSTQTGTWPCE